MDSLRAHVSNKENETMKKIGLALIVVGLAGIFLSPNFTGRVVEQPSYETRGFDVVNGLITVSAGNHRFFTFAVPSGVIDATLSGNFYASGGSGNDIEVLVLDETNYINWNNGHKASIYYDSGKLTTGEISASLSAGNTYYLVYSNEFSLLSEKRVNTKVGLTYQVRVS